MPFWDSRRVEESVQAMSGIDRGQIADEASRKCDKPLRSNRRDLPNLRWHVSAVCCLLLNESSFFLSIFFFASRLQWPRRVLWFHPLKERWRKKRMFQEQTNAERSRCLVLYLLARRLAMHSQIEKEGWRVGPVLWLVGCCASRREHSSHQDDVRDNDFFA